MTKTEQIHRTLTEMPKASDMKISRILGCESKDVQRIRAEMKAKEEIPEREVDEELIDDI